MPILFTTLLNELYLIRINCWKPYLIYLHKVYGSFNDINIRVIVNDVLIFKPTYQFHPCDTPAQILSCRVGMAGGWTYNVYRWLTNKIDWSYQLFTHHSIPCGVMSPVVVVWASPCSTMRRSLQMTLWQTAQYRSRTLCTETRMLQTSG